MISTAVLLNCQLQFLSVAEGIAFVTSTTISISSIPIASIIWHESVIEASSSYTFPPG